MMFLKEAYLPSKRISALRTLNFHGATNSLEISSKNLTTTTSVARLQNPASFVLKLLSGKSDFRSGKWHLVECIPSVISRLFNSFGVKN